MKKAIKKQKNSDFSFMENMLTYLICAIAVAVVIFTAFTLFKAEDVDRETTTKGVAGYHFFIVLSGSMTEEFAVGDVAVTKKVDTNTIEEGDIISFVSIDPQYMDEIVTHKIRTITEYEGQVAYETYGTTTGVSDSYPALPEKVIGKYQFTIPKIGNLAMFIQGKYGFLFCIIVPIAIIFILQISKLIKVLFSSNQEEEKEDYNESY